MATKAPSRLIRVLVHSHQNSRGSPETVSRAASLRLATDMWLPRNCGKAVSGGTAGGTATRGTAVSAATDVRTLQVARFRGPVN
ncbi:hypothetical protein GCM10010331_64280 [Streptomyces xanthochromogenes]|nr:hypothetical protein GCM10010331_64280 [Streptomyces xanthochromogenes]